MKIKNRVSILAIILVVGIAGCVKLPDDIVAPKWDTNFNVPITNKTYKLSDIIKPQKYIDLDSDSNYIFSSEVYEYSTGVAEYLDQSSESISTDDKIIAENVEFDIYLPFPGGIKLSKAVFREGLLNFHALNKSNSESISIYIKIPGIKDQYGKVVSSQLNLAPGDSGSIGTILNDHIYLKPVSQSSELDNGMLIKVTASSSSNTAEANIGFISSGFKFKSATGYFPPKPLALIEHNVKLKLGSDISNFKGNIYLAGAVMKLKAQYLSSNPDPFELELRNLQITGQSLSDNQQEQLIFKTNSEINSPASSTISFKLGTVDTVFNESNSTINDFISFIPDEMLISTSPIMNPDDDQNYKTVTEQDSIKMESYLTTQGIDLNSNALLTIKKSTLVDTVELNMDQSNRDALADGQAADISIQVNNYIPLTSWIKIILADSNYHPLTTITTGTDGVDSLKFAGAEVNLSNGQVTNASQSDQAINLNSSQILSFSKAYYAILSVTLETSSSNQSNPARVLLKANDWVSIRVVGSIKYNINPGN